MKVSVWRSRGEDSDSIDFELDASNKEEVKEFEKYIELFLGIYRMKTPTDEDLKEILKTHCCITTAYN